MADIKTITVSNTQYNVKDETARTTKQDKTDNTLATTAKTVVGAINEINNKFPVISTNLSSAGQAANKVLVTDGANGFNYANCASIASTTNILKGDGSGNAVAATVDSAPTSGSTNLVTSGGVADGLDEKANTDGYYSTMGVGTADNLAGYGSVEATYTYRPTAGTNSIGSGAAEIESIHGNTIVWNQLVGSETTSVTVPSGHKYRFYDKDGTDTIVTSTGTAIAVTGGDDMVFDLTAMFGSGNEPSTVAEFKALFPLNYYAYNAGSLLSFNGTGIKTDGFNRWDEQWEVGMYDYTTGEPKADVRYLRSKSTNYIDVFPNTTYYAFSGLKGTTYLFLFFYDENKNLISYFAKKYQTFTTPSNARHMRFFTTADYGTTYNNDICINLSWSGYRNGEYEAYWNSTLSLPISTYFANGMRSAGSAYDELTPSKAITRIGAVDLGTLNWSYASGENSRFAAILSGIKKVVTDTTVGNVICSRFSRDSISNMYQHISDNTIGVHNSLEQIWVYTTSYTDAAAFKTAMNGVYLFYELATPTEVTISPALSLRYRVSDFGTESLLPVNTSTPTTSPIVYEVTYPMNAVDTLRNLDKNYENQSSMDAFATALASAKNFTWSKTWDSTNAKYNYTIASTGASVGTQTITIAVADWSGGTTCTKSVSGVTTSNTVIVDSSDSTVTATAQGSGTLTFTATATPTAVVTVKVVVM